MLRIHLLQQWYSLSDAAMEDALITVPSIRRLAGINPITDMIPDETTILAFRHLLEKHRQGEQIFETVKAHLSNRGMTMRQGIIVDATLIAEPSSTKNKERKRDPEIHQSKKGNQWHSGMKVHLSEDKDSGLIHSVITTAANAHNLTPAQRCCMATRTWSSRTLATRYRRKARDGNQNKAIPSGDAPWQAQSPSQHSRGKAFESDRDVQSAHPCQRRASLPSDRTAFSLQRTRLRNIAENRCKVNMLAALTKPDSGKGTIGCGAMSDGLSCSDGQGWSLNQLNKEDEVRRLLVTQVPKASVSPRGRKFELSRA